MTKTARKSREQNPPRTRAEREAFLQAFEEGRLVDEVNEFHIYVLHPAASFPFGRKSRATATPVESGKDLSGEQVAGRDWQRTFESHHNAEGCSPWGQIERTDWSPGNSPGQAG